jgi:PKD repeat protein
LIVKEGDSEKEMDSLIGTSLGRRRGRAMAALVVMISVLLTMSLAGCLKDDGDNNGNGNTDPPRAKIKVDLEEVFENGTIEFSGEDSTGDIKEYLWDFGDGDEGNGEVLSHTYREVGEYRVRLTVLDTHGEDHTDTHFIHVHHKDEHSGRITTTQSRSYVIGVEENAEGIKATLTYPTGSVIAGQPSNDLDIELYYPNGTLYMSSDEQEPDTGTTQTEWLNVPKQELMASFFGNWRMEITADTGIEVDFDVEVVVTY